MNPDGLTQHVTFPNWQSVRFSPKQLALYRSNARKVLVCGGRYSGKDRVMGYRTLRLAHQLYAQNRDNPPHTEGAVVEVGVFGPQSDNFDAVFDKYLADIPDYQGTAANGHPNRRVLNKEKEIHLFGNGIRIRFLTLHGGGFGKLGSGFDIIHVTEAAFIEETTLRDVIIPLVIRPTFASYVQLNSTPENNWYDHAIESALKRDGAYRDYEAHCLTSFDNPRLEQPQLDEILLERDTNYARFERRYLGKLFVEIPTDIGSQIDDAAGVHHVFAPEWLDKCWISEAPKLEAPYRCLVDIAWTGRDTLAVVVLDSNNVIADIECHRNNDIPKIVSIFERLNREWQQPQILYDAQGKGDRLYPHLQGHGLRIKPVKTPDNKSKIARVERAVEMIRAGKIKIPHPDRYTFGSGRMRSNCQRLRKEMLEYIAERKETANGSYWFYGKPVGGSDDIVDALLLCANVSGVAVDNTRHIDISGY